MAQTKTKWIRRWRSWIAEKPSMPGVYKRKEGGYLVRGRARCPRTGKVKEIRLTLAETTRAADAYDMLQKELEAVRTGGVREAPQKRRFDDYAVSLLERKVKTGEVKSAQSRALWSSILEHHLLPAFGHRPIDEIRRLEVEEWKAEVAGKIRAGKLSPHTANSWLRVLKVILGTAVIELELERNPVAALKSFDTSEHVPFTDEEPNALTPEETAEFLAATRSMYPQYFAFVALGFSTGLRPSSIRPLRRKGEAPDVLLDEGVLLVRRSHTRRDEVMNTTKTKRRQRITLPPELIEILRWHIDRLQEGPMRESDLLFPSETGGFRAHSCLKKPFADVGKAIGLKKAFTPKGMRRTFQDLARAAEVGDLVTRAVSGHVTASMQAHYSTVRPEEIQSGLGKVIDLAGARQALDENHRSPARRADSEEASADRSAVHDRGDADPGGVHGGVRRPET